MFIQGQHSKARPLMLMLATRLTPLLCLQSHDLVSNVRNYLTGFIQFCIKHTVVVQQELGPDTPWEVVEKVFLCPFSPQPLSLTFYPVHSFQRA
jgi:hypothetical protein